MLSFLARFAPQPNNFLKQPGVRLRYKSYHWGVNDASSLGSSYSYAQFLIDAALNK